MKIPINSSTAALDLPGGVGSSIPEFGRVADVQRLFGIKRGTFYNLLKGGIIKTRLVKVTGQRSGVRLVDLKSVREFILSQPQTVEAKKV